MVQAKTSPILSHKVKNSLTFLLRRIRRNPEFPAVSQHITEITEKLSGDKKADADDISNTILKDYALTHKILRLVNSASYGNYGGEISTISRAVVILGFEKIRSIALSVILFDSLGKKSQVDTLKDTICCSFLSAVVAKRLAQDINDIDIENAFISSMFNNLGEFLTIHYFPKEYQEIQKNLEADPSNPIQAVRSVLGASFAELGTAIAEEWKLPESLISSMQDQSDGNISKPDTSNKAISHLSSFSNELSNIAGSNKVDDDKQEAIEKLSARYQSSIKTTPDYLQDTLADSLSELADFSSAIGINITNSTFYHQLTNENEEPADQPEEDDFDIDMLLDTNSQKSDGQLILIKGITDITETMLGHFELADIINMVVETLYRGMHFDRVIFCLRNKPKMLVQARFGLGNDIREIISKFSFKTSQSNDIFNKAINNKKEFVILDVNNAHYQRLVPDWCRELTNPASVTLFPVIINNQAVGLFYADNLEKTQMTSEQIQFFSALRNQTALAIQHKKGQR